MVGVILAHSLNLKLLGWKKGDEMKHFTILLPLELCGGGNIAGTTVKKCQVNWRAVNQCLLLTAVRTVMTEHQSSLALLLMSEDFLWRHAVGSAMALAEWASGVLALQHYVVHKQDVVRSLINVDSFGAEVSLPFWMCLQGPPVACVICRSAYFCQVTDCHHLTSRVSRLECLSGVRENIGGESNFPPHSPRNFRTRYFVVEKG